jgi:thiamine-phosphate diphosphorylase
MQQSLLSDILNKIYLITPNYDEAQTLFGNSCSDEEIQRLADRHGVNILIKGGHRGDESPFVCDSLYSVGGQRSDFRVLRSAQRKHGTGCMLSAAIVAYLAKGFTLRQAVGRGQLYVASNIKKSRGMLFLNAKNDYNISNLNAIRLMYITHPHPTLSLCHQIELACHAGIKLVQLRLKDSGEAELLEYARAAVDICHRHDALLIVNDSVDVCLQAGADGVHLGKEDEAVDRARQRLDDDKIIGATCNTFADVQHAYRMGADYVGIGPFRHTTTKQRLSPILGIDGLADIALQMKAHGMYLPTYAIGGITAADAGSIAECGIHGVAISSAILGSNDFEGCTRKIYENIASKKKE